MISLQLTKQYYILLIEYYKPLHPIKSFDILLNKLTNYKKQLIEEYNKKSSLEIEELWLKDLFYFENKTNINNYEKLYFLITKRKIIKYCNFLKQYLIEKNKIELELNELTSYIQELNKGLNSLSVICKNNNKLYMVQSIIYEYYVEKLNLHKIKLTNKLIELDKNRINKIKQINL